ncbi:glycoside hydrolase family 9 protein [Sphingomonas sp.]|uniref:glycoside hydrolase family 9 protein n=1 Tax=Sphingomonas sp. TaxID=28214 RepID=UPI001B063C18|nr:glycoside hydrolase family 9 protein [Sphingomonas sp.]MBO9713429.1 glycoside hydrolase family 9 protein [Sphingomonas sp.]
MIALLLGAATPALAQQAEPVPPIQLNQLGFETFGPKRAIVVTDAAAPQDWVLLDARGKTVASGKTIPFGPDKASGKTVQAIDVSSFHTAGGGYRLRVGAFESRAFAIQPRSRMALRLDALHFFYHQRAGVPVEAQFAGATWARPAGHAKEIVTCVSGADPRGTVWPSCPYSLDVTGGWYDAGDQGKYVVNGGIAVWTLLNAWEREHRAGKTWLFADGSMKIPESGNHVDDLLDEARYELEFLLSMQVPDGTRLKLPVGKQPPWTPPSPGMPPGPPPPLALPTLDVDAGGMAHHKVADRNWTKLPTPPAEDREERILFPPTTAATLNLAAVTAQCARIWKGIDDAFAERCLAASERAWAAARRNPEVFALAAFTGSGGYGDRELSDEFYWAAAELFATTGKAEYLDFVRASPWWEKPVQEPNWGGTATLGTLTLALTRALPEADRAHVDAAILEAADRFLEDSAKTGYHLPYDPPGWPWGSTSSMLNRAIVLAYAHDAAKAPKYREGVVDVIDYLLGRNSIDQSFVSGYGARPLSNPHHRFWAHSLDPKLPGPPPGVLSGGPNSTSTGADPVGARLAGHCAPMACYADDIQAFALNEVAINWNAPLVWVAAWLDATEGASAH